MPSDNELQGSPAPGLKDRFMYDPVVKGFDTNFWKAITGTPTVSGGDLRFNADEATSYSQYVYGDFIFAVNVPNTPSGSEARQWGLLNNAAKTVGAAYFEITGSTFQAVTYDEDTRTQKATSITWNSRSQTWEAVMTLFRIIWTANYVRFYVTTAAAPDFGEHLVEHATGDNIPHGALALNIKNVEADNMDLDYLLVQRAAIIIT